MESASWLEGGGRILREVLLTIMLFAVWMVSSGCQAPKNRIADGGGVAIPLENSEERARFIIVGFGWVSLSKPKNNSSVVVSNQHAIGASYTDHSGPTASVGYHSSLVTTVPSRSSDVRVSVEHRPFGRLSVQSEQIPENLNHEQ